MAEPIDHVEVVAAEGAALIAAVRHGPLEANVAACPGWTLLDLARHVGTTWRWATTIVAERRQVPGEFDPEPDYLAPEDALPWLDDALVPLIDALRSCPPDEPMWGFGLKPRTAAFWPRRQAMESAVHRVDAELAAGTFARVDPAVASDGIGEFVDVMLPRQYYRKEMPPGELVVTASDTGAVFSHGDPAGGTATLTGTAQDVFLYLWHRGSLSGVAEGGDPAILAGWKALGAP